jgi:adenylyltransferase/sulfurtransferase
MYDALAMRFREIRIRRDPDCPLCGAHPTITELLDYEEFCGLDAADIAWPAPSPGG